MVVPGQLLGLVLSALMRPLGWAPSHFLPKPLCCCWPSLAPCGASIFRALAVSRL